MLTGRVPFDGETVGEVLMKHLTARPDLSMLPEPYRSIVGQGPGQGPEPAARAASTTCCRPTTRPGARTSGSSARARSAPPPAARRPPAGRRAEEDVLRIEAEEPVFYIGPETRPPRSTGNRAPAERQAGPRPRRRKAATARAAASAPLGRRPPPRAGRRARPSRRRCRSGRIRVAELATSMLWAAPLAALLALPAASVLGIQPAEEPRAARVS